MAKLETVARQIMRKTKGWTKKDQDEDLRDYPYEHTAELRWIVRVLEKVQRGNVKVRPSWAQARDQI